MFRNLSIGRKLAIILVAPLLALTVVATVGIVVNLDAARRADVDRRDAGQARAAVALVNELQRERNASVVFVTSGRRTGADVLAQQRQATDAAHTQFAELVNAGGVSEALQPHVTPLRNDLDRLAAQREGVDAAPGARQQPAPAAFRRDRGSVGDAEPLSLNDVNGALGQYDVTIQSLLAFAGAAAADTPDQALRDAVASTVALSQYKEYLALEWDLASGLVSGGGPLGAGGRERLIALVTEKDLWLAEFERLATQAQLNRFIEAAGTDRLRQHEDQLLQSVAVNPNAETVTAWHTDGGAQFDRLQIVETEGTGEVVRFADDAVGAARQRALLYGLLLVLGLATAAVGVVLTRSLTGPLARLRNAAHDVADQQLPAVVAELQRAEGIPTPPEVHPIEVGSRDEIGQVAEAFNAIHRTAVQVATEQATMRRGVSEMFLNLARRNQALVDRQLELIDELERSENDPDSLEELFRLDHLATRMRRTAEDLIVLSGAKPARRWSQPVPLADTIRAAIAEVEDYTRVELLPIEDLGVVGQAVADVVHLLAELIENATAFSPPGTKVHVAGQTVTNGYVVEIEDRGIGMSDSELLEANERLSNPFSAALSVSQRLGLFVVARLADRYDIKVQLRHSWYDGITALVFLPDSLLVTSGALQLESARQTNGNGFPAVLPELGASMDTIATKTDLPPDHPENLPGLEPRTGAVHPPAGTGSGEFTEEFLAPPAAFTGDFRDGDEDGDGEPAHDGETTGTDLQRADGGNIPRLAGQFPRTGEFPRAGTGEFPRSGDFPPVTGDFPPVSGDFPPVTGDFERPRDDVPEVTGEIEQGTWHHQPAPRADDLPIFEQTRSDWFDEEPPDAYPLRRLPRYPSAGRPTARGPGATDPGRPQDQVPPHPPNLPRRPPGGLPRRQPGSGLPSRAPDDNRPGPRPADGVTGPSQPPPPRRTSTGLPMRRPGAARPPGTPAPEPPMPSPMGQPDGPAASPASDGGPRQTTGPLPRRGRTGAAPRTGAGLPRRVPQANRPPAAAVAPAGEPANPAPPNRSPDDIRSMLSRYRTGFERGRHEAAAPEERRPEDRQPPVTERHRDGTAAPRSDDDAVE